MNIWLYFRRALIGVLTAAAIMLGVLIQLVLVMLVCLLLPDRVADLVAFPILLGATILIGAGSYFIYQRVMCTRSVRGEAERWLADRSRRTPQQRARLRRFKQIGIWIPTLLGTIFFLFAPEIFGVATHVLNPGPARLIGYEVSFPVTWIFIGASSNDSHTWAVAGAIDCRGPLRGGRRRYWPLNPQASAVDVITSSSGSSIFRRNPNTPVSVRSVRIGAEPALCREYPRYYDWEPTLRIVECSTLKEGISISFAGDKSNLDDFYHSLELIRKTR